jgi:hypothetical protein
VPVIELGHLTPEQKKAYILADNRLAENAGWDDELLKLELAELKAADFDLDLMGFSDKELEELLNGDESGGGLTEDDAIPEAPVDPVSRPGDLWILGNHRLLCGDSTVLSDVERLMGGQLADMAFTDPPYNVDYGNSAKDKMRGKDRRIMNDDLGEGFFQFLYDACLNLLVVTKGACYVAHELFRAAHLAKGLDQGRRQVVHVHHLVQEHLHTRSCGLPAPVRTDPVRLEAGLGSLLVRRPRSVGHLELQQAPGQRPAPDHETGRAGRAGHQEFIEEPGHRAGLCSAVSGSPPRVGQARRPERQGSASLT